MTRRILLGLSGFGFALTAGGVIVASTAATKTLHPRKDGTLWDGGVYGTFDGIADRADWYFNGSTFEGAISLLRETSQSSIEHRVVWEYDLSALSKPTPVTAKLTFSLRGTPVSAAPDAEVFVYAYPADLRETLSDFSAGPAEFQGAAVVAPRDEPPPFTINVSRAVNQALADGTDRVGFRFQINPDTPHVNSQAFIDANEEEPQTKPLLLIEDTVPGDANGDDVVDLQDHLWFVTCSGGPGTAPDPGCEIFDFDGDTDVDQQDFVSFLWYFEKADQ